jgi:hypothetical protein
MGTQVGRWLGTILARLAAGSIPADGFYAVSAEDHARRAVSRPRPSRHFAIACDAAPVAGQTQFVRGLC